MRDLTPRQQQVLSLIRQHIADTGFPPTRAEIAARLGFRSANAAEEHLKALARKDVIELTAGASRGIRLKRVADATNASSSAVQVVSSLPLIGRVAAGSPILAQEHVEASYAIDPNLFSETPDYLLRVRGMSMRDAGILDGDLLAVQKASDAKNGQIVVARLGDEVTVKRFRRTKAGIELIPENPEFDTIVVPAGDGAEPSVAIEGIAVGLLRNNMLT